MRLGPPLGEALRARLGSPTVVRRLSSSPRSRVWLAEFDGSPAIVKEITGGADADDRYTRETTALRLGRRVRPHVVPGLLGTDPEARVLVLEYLAEPGRVPAREWMTDYAIALARLPSENWRWGTATARQRLLHRLTVVAALGADHPELAGLAQVSSAMRDKMLARWPGIRELPVADGDPPRGSGRI